MHELGIARNIVAIVCERAGSSPVACVTLEIGAHSGVSADAIAFCFPVVAEGTACANARLEIRAVPARARCHACGLEFELSRVGTACSCGSRDYERISGTELNVKDMQLEAA